MDDPRKSKQCSCVHWPFWEAGTIDSKHPVRPQTQTHKYNKGLEDDEQDKVLCPAEEEGGDDLEDAEVEGSGEVDNDCVAAACASLAAAPALLSVFTLLRTRFLGGD